MHKTKLYSKSFPLITRTLKIFRTIFTNTTGCERSFSCLMRVKTYLRKEKISSLATLQLKKRILLIWA